ncbi:SMI1/KNR4 family protein [Deinococcus roseus]|uniref:Knr4/Smi1-like domain-containing protein n=1 Tax=Deinococcus roseus TaxID=392414 RepID=A0ABQ2D0G9_9DEIO|nr:SMI1/KNR4 family protein [Deinococcus roseus]GGJ38719.1 hypothetical protein GCM10008938_26040 [Deinococcus roseus]
MSIKALWDTLEAWYAENVPHSEQAFMPPASEAEISELETLLGAPLPEDFKTSLRIHNGVSWYFVLGLFTVEEMKRYLLEEEPFQHQISPRSLYFHSYDQFSLYLSIDPDFPDLYGSINQGDLGVLYPSFTSWLEEVVEYAQAGIFVWFNGYIINILNHGFGMCDHCIHRSTKPGLRELRTCKAFQTIPVAIHKGLHDHRYPFDGDGGIRFEAMADAPAWVHEKWPPLDDPSEP